MITSVDSVIIGKRVPTNFTIAKDLQVGDVAMFNQDKVLIKGEDDFKAATAIYIGVAQPQVMVTMPNGEVQPQANIYFSNKLDIKGLKSAVYCGFQAPVEDKVVINSRI